MTAKSTPSKPSEAELSGDGDLGDLLQELRVLLPGAQTLTAFLVILPFNQGFAEVRTSEKWVYLATFICSVLSLCLFTAPAAQHRLERPLRDRERFKRRASITMIVGLVPLSLALILATFLVVGEVIGDPLALAVSGGVATVIGAMWWIVPVMVKHQNPP